MKLIKNLVLTLQYHSLAKKELREAIYTYEQQRRGRGRRFNLANNKVLKIILSNPLSFPKDFEEVRKATITKFPYSIYYQIFGEEIFIYSVFHNRRNPDEWQKRIN